MKKIFISIFAMIQFVFMIQAQYQFNLSDNWLNTTICAPGVANVSGQTSLTFSAPGGGFDPCSSSSVTVQLQKYNGSTWPVQTSALVNTGFGAGTYNFNINSSGTYRIVGVPSSGTCGVGTFTTFIKTPQVITINTGPSASYKIDGIAVNNSTYIQFYNCAAASVQMTNIIGTGTNSVAGSPGNTFGYQWKVVVTKVGSLLTGGNVWNTSALPANYDVKNLIIVPTWGAANVSGKYTVELWVKNNCNTVGVAYSGKIQINAAPSATSSCFTISTNNGCSTFAIPGTQSAPAAVCSMGPKINGSCSGGQYIGGYFRLRIDEYSLANVFLQTVVNTANTTINSTLDIQCLDINVLSTPSFYFASSSGNKYKVTWTIGNSCGENSSIGWFIDVVGGCRPSGTTGLTDVNSNSSGIFSIAPNPASEEVILNWQSESNNVPLIQVFNMYGRLVQVPMKSNGLGEMKLDISTLSKGIYTIELNNGKKSMKRLVIQ
jgi:Secretion system C-terminal sorting domain